MRKIVFELCAETLDACLVAQRAGAARIELCSGLSEGGLTPSHALIREVIRMSGLPVHVLIRPRGGSYVYSSGESELMAEDICHAKSLGAAGVVLGVLCTDGSVDVAVTRALVDLARPMEVTFHRAFDSAASVSEALESVIDAGCQRVLTSGGQPNALQGAKVLAALVTQAAGRIDVAVGGGLRLHNAATLARLTQATHFHGSMQSKKSGKRLAVPPGTDLGYSAPSEDVDPESVRKVIERLQSA